MDARATVAPTTLFTRPETSRRLERVRAAAWFFWTTGIVFSAVAFLFILATFSVEIPSRGFGFRGWVPLVAVLWATVGARTTPAESATAPISSAATGATRTRAVPLGTGRVAEAVRNARAAVSSAASRGPRRARLFVKRIDPWSVMKFSFAVSFVLFFVAIVATAVLYLALDAMGVFNSVNRALSEMIGATGSKNGGFKITALGVIGVAGVLGLVNVVLFTALATLSAFIYNVCADLVGGIEVTLSERE